MTALTQKTLGKPSYPLNPVARTVVAKGGRYEVQEGGVAIGSFPTPAHANAFAAVPEMVVALREQLAAIDALGEQIDQMRGLFNEDRDPTIAEAMEAGEAAAQMGSAVLTQVLA
jgi:hypothetical protein